MKQQRKLIEHLIEYSKPTNPKIIKPQKQEEEHSQTLDLDFNNNNNLKSEKDSINMSAQLQVAYSFEVCVEIGDGRCDYIMMNEKSRPEEEAQKFCHKHKLEPYIVNLLAESLAQQAKKEVNQIKNQYESKFQTSKKCIEPQRSQSQTRVYKNCKNSQELWKQPEQQFTRCPKINSVSSQIVKKMGKSKIIESMTRKFQEKAQQHLLQQIQNEQNEFEGFSFHPSIDPISRKVDQTLHFSRNLGHAVPRYDHLYQQHRLIENRKQIRRRNSLMEIPFRPNINPLSRVIMSKKKSLGQLYPLSADKEKPKTLYKDKSEQKNRFKSKRQSLNTSAAQMCYHLYEEAKKREQKIKKEADKIYGNQNNWKIIESSNNLVFSLRQNRIREIFDQLVKPPHQELHYSQIDESKLNNVERIFAPIFKQMKQMETGLNREEFVQAGMRLLKYLSPNDRAILIRKSTHNSSINKQNLRADPLINKKSKQIVQQKSYGQKSIYVRGLVYRNQIKNQIQKGKEQKVRNQLKGCTFKPKINTIPQNANY